MARIVRLTEQDLARIVRQVITEQKTAVNTVKKTVNATPPLKTIVFTDPSATKTKTNIDILPQSMRLISNHVSFSYRIAGRTNIMNGIFYCSTNNQIKLTDIDRELYISNKRAVTLKSKCGQSQGYASTNTVVDTNLA